MIKNSDELSTSELRKAAVAIIEAGLISVLPRSVMESTLLYDATSRVLRVRNDEYAANGRIFVVGGGKASGAMAVEVERIVRPENIEAGVVNTKGGSYQTSKVKVNLAGHPVPDERGMEGVSEIFGLKERHSIGADDIVLCLLSGGGSALMPAPVDGVSLADAQGLTRKLLSCGAEIHEINIVRRHLSRLKGGRLGKFFAPATVLTLIISDVIGNDLNAIASGPTATDSTTFGDALGVLEKYDLLGSAPQSVIKHLKKGDSGEIPDTPGKLENCANYIISDVKQALNAMADAAEGLNFAAHIITSTQKGDAAGMARQRAGEIKQGKYQSVEAVLIGGETTVIIPESHGKGGRNQHYAAVTLKEMRGYPNDWLCASVGTDGSDFIRDVAGAMVDCTMVPRIPEQEVSTAIEFFDTNTLFAKAGGSLIMTGETGTNVGDVILYLLPRKV